MMLSRSRSALSRSAYATWSTTAKGSKIALSGSDLTATTNSTGYGTVTTGGPYLANTDRYWETLIEASSSGAFIGMVTAAENLENQLGLSAESFGMSNSGSFRAGGTSVTGTGSSFNPGDIVTIRYQGALLKVTYYVNGVLKYPVTLSYAVAGAPAATLNYAGFGARGAVTANFGSTPPTYPIAGSTWGWPKA